MTPSYKAKLIRLAKEIKELKNGEETLFVIKTNYLLGFILGGEDENHA